MKLSIQTGMLAIAFALMGTFSAQAQDKKERSSPPMESSAKINGAEVTVNYSAPSKKDREVFGKLVPYGKVWRTGANEATTITFESDANVGGTAVKAGKYALFTVPGENKWEIILNTVWDQWGAYNYDASKDAVRISAPVYKTDEPVEQFTIEVSSEGLVTIAWDTTSVTFEVQ